MKFVTLFSPDRFGEVYFYCIIFRLMREDCDSIWNDCLRVIRDNVAEQSFNTWFKPIVPLKCSDEVLTIQVPSQFFYEWLEEHYIHILKKAITSCSG